MKIEYAIEDFINYCLFEKGLSDKTRESYTNDLLVISDGTIIKNMKFIDKYEKKLKGLNRWLSRCQKGSKNREKVKIKISPLIKIFIK